MAAVFLFSLSTGRYTVTPGEILAFISGRGGGLSPRVAAILANIRLPRTCGALLAGVGLASSGAAYQSLFRNPLAAPDLLGAVAGASFGAALGILLNRGEGAVQAFAFCGGLAAVSLTWIAAALTGRERRGIITLVLIGMVVGGLFSALVSVVKYFADVDSQLPAMTFWLMGGLAGLSPRRAASAGLVILPCTALLLRKRWALNLLSFDDDESRSMGLSLKRERGIIILLSTLLCSAAVSLCGPVGWAGLLVPHAARMISGANYQRLLPLTVLLGGIYMMLIDIAARNAARVEIPLGVLTALIGAPFFIVLLFRGNYFKE
jgi:iron complex transport system permease protein